MARDLPPPSPFAGDDGSTDPHLAPALTRRDAAQRLRDVVDALPRARLLVPVVAHLDERADPVPGAGGMPIAGEKQASAAMVTVAAPDGRAAMPVFSGMAALRQWRADARPVPVPGPQAALASVTEADGLLVLDPGGPVTVLVPRPAVWAVAQGRSWVPADQDPQVRAQITGALGGLTGVRDVDLQPGPSGATQVVLTLPAGLSRAEVEQITTAAGRELARCDLVAERVDAVQLRVRAC